MASDDGGHVSGPVARATRGAYSRRNKVMIGLFVCLMPALGLGSCSVAIGATLLVLGPRTVDPPPGDTFPVHVVNDTQRPVQVQLDHGVQSPVTLAPGA